MHSDEGKVEKQGHMGGWSSEACGADDLSWLRWIEETPLAVIQWVDLVEDVEVRELCINYVCGHLGVEADTWESRLYHLRYAEKLSVSNNPNSDGVMVSNMLGACHPGVAVRFVLDCVVRAMLRWERGNGRRLDRALWKFAGALRRSVYGRILPSELLALRRDARDASDLLSDFNLVLPLKFAAERTVALVLAGVQFPDCLGVVPEDEVAAASNGLRYRFWPEPKSGLEDVVSSLGSWVSKGQRTTLNIAASADFVHYLTSNYGTGSQRGSRAMPFDSPDWLNIRQREARWQAERLALWCRRYAMGVI